MHRVFALLFLALAVACSTPAPTSVTVPDGPSLVQVDHQVPPPAPSELAVVSVEKEKGDWFVTLQWKDNATEEFNTCFRLSGDNSQTYCATSGNDYPEGVDGTHQVRFRVARGDYSVIAYATNWHESGLAIFSEWSAPVTFSAGH